MDVNFCLTHMQVEICQGVYFRAPSCVLIGKDFRHTDNLVALLGRQEPAFKYFVFGANCFDLEVSFLELLRKK